ncbi:MAG TPA: alpha-glucosidase C-terminal domain-containing protein, partial [Acidimicrobiales bacterium]|nr:alpha-glucosidase C-terminal domain-containing protein [Acidimicrobiales bacterium]
RKELPTIGFGEWCVVPTEPRSVLAHRCDWNGSTVVAVHNFSPEPCRFDVELEGCDDIVGLDDLLGRDHRQLDMPRFEVTLDGYGYRWFLVRRAGQRLTP